jgi:predicted nuclease with TOPRIM domain
MNAVREAWTDERLDDLNTNVGRRFDEVDRRFDEVDRRFDEVDRRFEEVDKRFEEVDKRFEEVDKRFEEVDKRFDKVDRRFDRVEDDIKGLRVEMNSRFDGLQRTLIGGAAAIIAALLAAPHL